MENNPKCKKRVAIYLIEKYNISHRETEGSKMPLHDLEKGVILRWLRKKYLKKHEKYCLHS